MSLATNQFIEAKIDKLLEMMQKSTKYGATSTVEGPNNTSMIMFTQDYIDVVEAKKNLIETGYLPSKTLMMRMNDIYKEIQFTENATSDYLDKYVVDNWDKNNHHPIEAIKDLRQTTGLGLREAKDIVDRCRSKGLIS